MSKDTLPPLTENDSVPDDYRNSALGYRAGWNDARAALAAQASQQALAALTENAEELGLYGEPQQAQGVAAGMVLVPLRMTQAMRDVAGGEDWQWEDLLAAAEAITEEEYDQLAAAPQAAPALQALTDEQIAEIYSANRINPNRFARAIEAAHGIGAKGGKP